MEKFKRVKTWKDVTNDPRVDSVEVTNEDSKYWVYLKFPYYNCITQCMSLPCRTVEEACWNLNGDIKRATISKSGRMIEIDGDDE
tara:strand:- start:601 stop:855 length:255 start_codon:yes stop_codon:yes gene_type:complete